jgi:hypothetical protein
MSGAAPQTLAIGGERVTGDVVRQQNGPSHRPARWLATLSESDHPRAQ